VLKKFHLEAFIKEQASHEKNTSDVMFLRRGRADICYRKGTVEKEFS